MTTVYRHKALPSLRGIAEREVVDELRKIERWGLNVNYKLQPFTVDNSQDPSRVTLDANLTLPFDRVIGFLNSTNSEPLGGIGNVPEVPDVLLFVGTAELSDWEDEATRRPVALGGSSVTIDAGQHMELMLPNVPPYEHGYTLGLAADGVTVIATPNPLPSASWSDSSADTGTALDLGAADTGWFIFPDGAGSTALQRLEIVAPSGTSAGVATVRAKVRVLNATTQTGTAWVGFGLDQVEPTADNQGVFVIPAGFSGSLDLNLTFAMPVDLTADLTVTVWTRVMGDHPNFELVTDTGNGDHTLNVGVEYSS